MSFSHLYHVSLSVHRARLPWIPFFMTASRKDFPGENFTTLRVGILIPNPVNGLRPGRALCSRTQKAPTPDHESISPRAIQSSKIFSKALISFEASTTHNPLAAATAFISSCLFMALFFISCFLFRRKLPLVTGRGQGKPSRGSPPGTCRACASSPTTRLPGSTPSGPFARPSRDRRVGYIVVISCAPASSHSLTSTVNLMGLPRISSPGSNGSTVGSSGCSFSGSTLPAPSEKSSV